MIKLSNLQLTIYNESPFRCLLLEDMVKSQVLLELGSFNRREFDKYPVSFEEIQKSFIRTRVENKWIFEINPLSETYRKILDYEQSVTKPTERVVRKAIERALLKFGGQYERYIVR